MAKKQHYVPRFLLKGFSLENNKLINVFLLNKRKTITNIGLKEQAQKKYLYGDDQKLENIFASIESDAAQIISKLRNKHLDLSHIEKVQLIRFIFHQVNRTPANEKQYNEILDTFVKNIASKEKKLKGKESEYSVSFNKFYHFMFGITEKLVSENIDLEIGILETNSKEFLIGQHPVITLNPFLEEKKWRFSKNGLGVKGTMVILPISSNIAIILFDKDVYKLLGKNNIVEINDNDVIKINKCQFYQSVDSIFFRDNYTNDELESLSLETDEYRLDNNSIIENHDLLNKDKISEVIRIANKDLPVSHSFSFYGIKMKELKKNISNHSDIKR